ncbi:MAG TPA: SpoIID/LytB domain-containing protein [Bacillota bacterium]|nr:SpoIID/LytB domain-containing protein [Bacillota bacterium]
MKKYLQMLLIFVLITTAAPMAVTYALSGKPIFPGEGTSENMKETPSDNSKSEISDKADGNDLFQSIEIYDCLADRLVRIGVEEYVAGVVYASMPASFGTEALKAQAIVIRTLVYYRSRHQICCDKHGTVLCTDGSCCLPYETYESSLGDVSQDAADTSYEAVMAAVAETAGLYLSYGEEPINALFHASSSGRTENSNAVLGEAILYLSSVTTPDESDLSVFTHDYLFTAKEFCRLTGLETNEADSRSWSIRSVTNESGRCETVLIEGIAFSGTRLMRLLGLASTHFDITVSEAGVEITSQGIGHGLGMSQYGACLMAKDGSRYEDILYHYYQNTVIVRADQ